MSNTHDATSATSATIRHSAARVAAQLSDEALRDIIYVLGGRADLDERDERDAELFDACVTEQHEREHEDPDMHNHRHAADCDCRHCASESERS